MSKHIYINTKKVHDIHALFSLFEQELGRDFWHNLDGLADILRDEEVKIDITNQQEFLRVFGIEATMEYLGNRYREDMPTLGEMLLEILHNRLLMK